MEERITAVRLTELAERPIEGRFDYDHMKAIHRYLFQDVYEWAGKRLLLQLMQRCDDDHASVQLTI